MDFAAARRAAGGATRTPFRCCAHGRANVRVLKLPSIGAAPPAEGLAFAARRAVGPLIAIVRFRMEPGEPFARLTVIMNLSR